MNEVGVIVRRLKQKEQKTAAVYADVTLKDNGFLTM